MPTEEKSLQVDPALAENLDELLAMANEIGVENAWIVRKGKNVQLSFRPKAEWEPFNLKIGDTGTLVVLHFPAGDGREGGLEECCIPSDI